MALQHLNFKVIHSYPEGFPAWFMASRVFAALKGTGIPVPSRIRPITVVSDLPCFRQALCAFGQTMTADIAGHWSPPRPGSFRGSVCRPMVFRGSTP